MSSLGLISAVLPMEACGSSLCLSSEASCGGRADTLLHRSLGLGRWVTRLLPDRENTPCHLALHPKSMWGHSISKVQRIGLISKDSV